jgi:hypothetical protein
MRLVRFLFVRGLVVAIGTALAVIVALVAGLWWYGIDDSIDRFVANFDRNVANDPILAAVVARDPKFRARVIVQTANAYASGGWPAANDRASQLMIEKEPEVTWAVVNAEDALIVELWRRRLAVMRKLVDRPSTCRLYVAGRGANLTSYPSASHEFAAAREAVTAAYVSGARKLDEGVAAALPSELTFDELLDRSTGIGKPFTPGEWSALRRRERGQGGAEVVEAVYCSAAIKLYENLLSFPESEAASAIRGYWGGPLSARFRRPDPGQAS